MQNKQFKNNKITVVKFIKLTSNVITAIFVQVKFSLFISNNQIDL